MTTARDRILCVAANPSVDRLYEVERLVPGEIHRPALVAPRAGGKGLNAARAAAALGGRVTAIGIVAGRAGDWIEEALAAAGVSAAFARSGGETRTCLSILDRESGTLTELYERGDPLAPGAWEALEAIAAEQLARGDVGAITCSGSLPVGAPVDGFARLARLAAAAGVPVLADVYGPALDAVLAERPALVKVNGAEAAEAAGMPVTRADDAIAAARRIRAGGAAQVVVTLGRDGAVAVDAAGAASRVAPPPVLGRYPVGSGDAFLGGLAVGLVGGADLAAATRLATAAAAANAVVPGAGDLDPATLEALR